MDILEAYFHASICAFYLCIAKKIPMDMLLKPETSEVSYPLLNLYILHEIYTNSYSNVQSSITIQTICEIDKIVYNGYEKFLNGLKMNGWNSRTNFLAVDACRSYMVWVENAKDLE